MPKLIEAKIIHFPHGFFGRPFLNRNSISGHENTGTIFAEATMHENPGLAIKQRKKLHDLLICRVRPAADGYSDEFDSQPPGFFPFSITQPGIFGAKVNDRGNADLFQLSNAPKLRLSAAVELIADLAGIRDAGDADFFRADRRDGRQRDWGRLRMRGANPRSEKKTKKT